jgi:hypothetical protein
LMMVCGAPPQGAAKYDGDHTTGGPGGFGPGTAAGAAGGRAFEAVHQLRHRHLWRVLDQQVEKGSVCRCDSPSWLPGTNGRTVHRIDRWHPSSKTCSACGHRLDTLSLRVRAWTCPSCAAVHDRDHNAALNILAAGQAERLNACGAQRSPSSGEAPGDEAGATPDAA